MPPWAPFKFLVGIILVVRVCPNLAVPVGPNVYSSAFPNPVTLPQFSSQAPPNIRWFNNAGGSSAVYRQPQMPGPPMVHMVHQVMPPPPMPVITAPCAPPPCAPPPCAPPPCAPPPCPCKKCKCKCKSSCNPCHCTAEDERIMALGQFLERANDYEFDPILDEPCERPKPCSGCKRPCPKPCCCRREEDFHDCDYEEEERPPRPPPKCSTRRTPPPPPPSRGGGRALESDEEDTPPPPPPRTRSSPGRRRSGGSQRHERGRSCGCSKPVCGCGKPVCGCSKPPPPCDCQPDPYDYYY